MSDDRSNKTGYAKRHIIRWLGPKRSLIAGSVHGLDAAVALARQLPPPQFAQETVITQGRIILWREVVHAAQ